MRPQTPGGTETIDRGVQADIMVVLDVSRSMLAEDAAPSRLARAKAEITEFIERVRDQRVGLGRVRRPGGRRESVDVGLTVSSGSRCATWDPGPSAGAEPVSATRCARRSARSARTGARRASCCSSPTTDKQKFLHVFVQLANPLIQRIAQVSTVLME